MPDAETRHRMRVSRIAWAAEGVLRVALTDPAGSDLPAWDPGAHLSLTLPNKLVRQYSLCSEPGNSREWEVAVLRDTGSRGGSAFIHASLRPGELIDVLGPRNNFRLEDAAHYLLVAGGIGITPILAMARELDSRGDSWSLVYLGRTRAGMAFLDELAEYGAHARVHVDDEAGGPIAVESLLESLRQDSLVYACGPGGLLACLQAEVPEGQLRLERFAGAATPAPEAGDEVPFDIVCAASGGRVHVAAGESAVEALQAEGFDVPTSCLEGFCGTCELKVLAGTVDHRDTLLSPREREANTHMYPCVSRGSSAEITLEI